MWGNDIRDVQILRGKKKPQNLKCKCPTCVCYKISLGWLFLGGRRIPESEIGCFLKKKQQIFGPRDGEFPVAAPTMTQFAPRRVPAWLAPARSPLGLVGRGCVVRPLALELEGGARDPGGRVSAPALLRGWAGEWWEVPVEGPGSQSSCAKEGNAGVGCRQNTPTSTASTHHHGAPAEPRQRLRSCSCCRCCSELVSVVGAAPAGERGDGAGGYSKWGAGTRPKEVSDPHCCLVPGVRPSLSWRRKPRVSGRELEFTPSPSVWTFRLSVNRGQNLGISSLPVPPLPSFDVLLYVITEQAALSHYQDSISGERVESEAGRLLLHMGFTASTLCKDWENGH